MRIRNIKNKKDIINSCLNYVKDPVSFKGKWSTLFNNSNPICVEIGCGRCKFITTLALNNPDINFIGIERIDTVLSMGIRDYDTSLPNLRLINFDAFKIDTIFSKEISSIYLNFSDPWPKKRHAKRRLTSPSFLEKYDSIFKKDKVIIQKTDNMGLFEYSIMSLSNYGYKIDFISLDLQNSDIHDNIMTEYEEKFTAMGMPIYMLRAIKK